jgi:Zn-dependent protease
VEVYHLSPSSSWLPVSLPRQWGLFMHYLLMLNVSFALFNALPLPALDGEALLAEFAMMGYLPEELIGWINSFSAWLPVMLIALFIGSLFQLLILPV